MNDEVKESEEAPSKELDGKALCQKWLREIHSAKEAREYKEFFRLGETIEKLYSNSSLQTTDKARVYYNLLYSTVQTLAPTYFARIPKPVTERPLKNDDPVAELAALIEERAVIMSNSLERDSLFRNAKQAVQDFMLPGRGQLWCSFFADTDEAGNVVNERVETEYVHWQDYLESWGRTPTEVRWRARRFFMTREELVQKFGEIGELVPLNCEENTKDYKDRNYNSIKQAEVWMICDVSCRCVCYVSDGYQENVLKYDEDPWKLNNFFPCPSPILYSRTNSSNFPTPFYSIVKNILEDLDFVHKRLTALVDCMRYVGVHDALWNEKSMDLRDSSDGQSSPVKNWAVFAEKGGFKGVQDWVPIDKLVQVISQLREHGQYLLNKFYEVSGISEVIRGYSPPSKTATAVQMEGQFTVLRTQEKQQEIQSFLREALDIKAQMIFELFSDATIMQMVGYEQMKPDEQAMFPYALQLLRDDKLRTFRIEIETDSTIAIDEEADKQGRMEFIGALGNLFNNAFQMASIEPNIKNLMFDVIKFGVRGFRAGRELEGDIDKYIKTIEEQDELRKQQEAEMANQPPQPSPEEIQMMLEQEKAMGQAQAKQMEMAIKQQQAEQKAQLDQMLAQHKITLEQMEAFHKVQLEREKLNAEVGIKAEKIRADMAVKAMEAADKERFATIEGMKSKQDKTPNITVVMPSGKKVARAVKAPDGSFIMQSEDVQ